MSKVPLKNAYRRSYLFKVDERCNLGKLQKVADLLAAWQELLPVAGAKVWEAFLAGTLTSKPLTSAVGADSFFSDTPLVTSVKQCMAAAIEGQLKTWKRNAANRIARAVMANERWQSKNELRYQLLWINRTGLWFVGHEQQVAAWAAQKPKEPRLSAYVSRLAYRLMRRYLYKSKGPKFDNLPLQVNQMSSVWAKARTKLDKVSHWLRLSTLDRGVRIELPVRENPYFNEALAASPGEQATTFSLITKGGDLYIKVVVAREKASSKSDGDTLGLDFGMTNLVATSKGGLFKQGFNEKLKKWDAAYLCLTKGLQEAGERRLSQAKRYRSFVSRFRSWLKSEIRQVVNQVLTKGQPATVVIEALGFHAQAGTLSAKMNRLVRKMGTGVFKEALAMKSEEQGFKLVEVNPAYTSQECRSCGFISRDNRRGNRFKCVCCKRTGHADALAAANLVERFNQGRLETYTKHKTVEVSGLRLWAERMLARISKSNPESPPHQGALRCARAGLERIKKNASTWKKVEALEAIERLHNLIVVIDSTKLNQLSTR